MHFFKDRKPLQIEEILLCDCRMAEEETENEDLSYELTKILTNTSQNIIFLCIGSDRSTGDSFGPLVGSMLKENHFPYPVFGTLSEPVHALNLENVLKAIEKKYKNSLLFGIDACLGAHHQIGSILLKRGPFRPGKALDKALPTIGHYHLTAVVNHLDVQFPFHSLNSTRLDTVMNLAKATSKVMIKASKLSMSRMTGDFDGQ